MRPFNLNANGYTVEDRTGTANTVTYGERDYSALNNTVLAGSDFTFGRTGTPNTGQTITITLR